MTQLALTVQSLDDEDYDGQATSVRSITSTLDGTPTQVSTFHDPAEDEGVSRQAHRDRLVELGFTWETEA